jgi:hypothetical protein
MWTRLCYPTCGQGTEVTKTEGPWKYEHRVLKIVAETQAPLVYSFRMKLPEEIRKMFAKAGRKGGKSTSPEKVAAARANGQRGGRPRKKDK